MKKALIFRTGAYGDIIHLSFLPHLLKNKGFDRVDVQTGVKGFRILKNNPYIDELSVYTGELVVDSLQKSMTRDIFLLKKHVEAMGHKFTKTFFLGGTIESSVVMMENQPEYFYHQGRRDHYAKINFYDQTLITAGFPEEVGKWQGEMYFTDEECDIVEKYIEQYKDKFTILINVAGTSAHKQLAQAEELVRKILVKYDDALIITTGGPEYKDKSLKHIDDKRVRTIIGVQPFRQAAHLTKHVNCVIGCESGLMIASNMHGTPTIQLMTAASLVNHCGYAKNDYSLQSPAYCSPCNKGPYQYVGCPIKDKYPLCVYFDTDKIMEQIGKIHD